MGDSQSEEVTQQRNSEPTVSIGTFCFLRNTRHLPKMRLSALGFRVEVDPLQEGADQQPLFLQRAAPLLCDD